MRSFCTMERTVFLSDLHSEYADGILKFHHFQRFIVTLLKTAMCCPLWRGGRQPIRVFSVTRMAPLRDHTGSKCAALHVLRIEVGSCPIMHCCPYHRIWWCSGKHSYVFGRSRVRISIQRLVSHGFPQSPQANSGIVSQSRKRPLPSRSLPIHSSQ